MRHQRGVIWVQLVAMHWFLLWKGVICGDLPGYSIQMPNNVTVPEGHCVTIPCTFTADNKTTFTGSTGIWKNSVKAHLAFSDESRHGTKPNFHVVGNPDNGNCTLTITDVKKEDAGLYHFRFEESETSWNKYTYPSTVTVNVTDFKDNLQITVNGKLIAGKEANLTCNLSAKCTGIVQWMKSNHNGTWKTSSFVTFIPSKSDHQTNVTCRVAFQNGKNVSSKNKKLNVLYPPSVTVTTAENKTIPRYENVSGQQPVTLICRADSNPEAMVTWYAENHFVNRNKSSAALRINITSRTIYTCSAWNELGMDLQHVVFWQVTIPSAQSLFQETTVRDILIGVSCGIAFSLVIVVLLFKFCLRNQPASKPDPNHTQECSPSQDFPPEDNNQLYEQIHNPGLQAAEGPNGSSNLKDVSYASIKFSKAMAKDTPMQPETEYSEIKFP